MIRGFGAIPTPVEVAELPTALMTGMVIGQENPLTMINANKLYEVQSHVMLTGHMQNVLPVFVNERAWQSISEKDRNAILEPPFIGAEELTRFMLICVVFVTFPYVVVSGTNIRLEEGLHLLPTPLRRAIHVAIAATGTVTLGIAAVAIAVATLRNLQNATPTLGIPYWVFFSASFFGFLFAALEFALQLWKALAGKPPYVTFADEASPDDMDALEAALVAEADRGAGEAP